MTLKSSSTDFLNGLVFDFDVGTGSIGYAVRNGSEFKDVGVLIFPLPATGAGQHQPGFAGLFFMLTRS